MTSKEQADSIVNQLAIKLADYPKLLTNEYALFIKESIPLTELLEVAKAASSDKRNSECTCYSDPDRVCRYCGYFIRLDKALEALRATNKIKGL